MKKLGTVLSLLGLVIASALVLGACGSSSDSTSGSTTGGSLKFTESSYPDYMDPQLSYTAEGWEAMWNTYIPLLTYDHKAGEPGTKVIPGLAQDLPKITNGGKTYTLTLRKGLTYSNGQPVKASDFEFAVKRMFILNSGGSSFYTNIVGAEQFQKTKKGDISGIKADEKTGEITIDLVNPSGTFNNELGLMFVAPVPQDTPLKDQSATPIPGTGTFEITKSDPGREFILERNPQWEKNNAKLMPQLPSAKVDKITETTVDNQSTQVNDIESNATDFMIDPPPPDRYAEVQSKYDGTQFRVEPTISTYYFWLNNKTAPFNDVKVRQAVNYAVEPDALSRIYSGQLAATQQILPPGMPGYKKFELYPYNLDKAKQLIKEANPSDRNITVWTDDEAPNDDAGTYLQDTLNKIGFNAKLKILNGDNYFTVIGNLSTPDLDAGFSDWFQDYPHPNDFFQPLLDGESIQPTNNNNFAQTDIGSLNKQQATLRQEQLTDAVKNQYSAMDKAYMEQAVWAPYGNRTLATFVSDRINFDKVYFHKVFNQDYTSFELK